MTNILGISGSLRKASFNTRLLHAAAALAPEGVSFMGMTIEGIPLYNQDVEEADGIPPAVTALKEAIRAADGVLLVTPEYNNSMPGVFKNAIDWASRPPRESAGVFRGRKFALIGASPGGFGTILSQNAWLPVLRTLEVDLWTSGRLMLSRAGQAFAEDGSLADPEQQAQLKRYLAGFTAFVQG